MSTKEGQLAYEQARRLAGDLASLWNGGRAVLAVIATAAHRRDGNAWAALHDLDPNRREGTSSATQSSIFDDARVQELLQRATLALDAYYSTPTWITRALPSDPELARLSDHPIAYFCAEFGLAAWLPLYSGGLGVLAGDVLKTASDLGLPMVGVGIFYEHGFFRQRLDAFDWQHEDYPSLDPRTLPLTLMTDSRGEEIRVSIPILEHQVYARIWSLVVGRSRLLLLDTNIDANPRLEDRLISGYLYGGDQDTRIRQEILLGIGGARALTALGIGPSIYSMNEGHAGFLTLELLGRCGEPPATCLPLVRRRVLYTNHTVVPAGNDRFPPELAVRYLAPLAAEIGVDLEEILSLGVEPGGEAGAVEAGDFSMAYLAFRTSGCANAVSRLHAQVIPGNWPGFPVEAVTNGVHLPTWMGPQMSALLDASVPAWRDGTVETWRQMCHVDDGALWTAHSTQREALVCWILERTGIHLDPEALTLVWARRIATYKRLDLLLTDPERLARLLNGVERPMQLIVAGKAHPQDEAGKQALHAFLERAEAVPGLSDRLVFIADYEIDVAGQLVAGADVWLNTPRRPLEASGTSGMKAGINGALQFTVSDGWAAELDWNGRGWIIDGPDDAAEALRFYDILEREIGPRFYDRDGHGLPRKWLEMMKSSMAAIGGHYSAHRMLVEYVDRLYIPLLRERGPGSDVAAE